MSSSRLYPHLHRNSSFILSSIDQVITSSDLMDVDLLLKDIRLTSGALVLLPNSNDPDSFPQTPMKILRLIQRLSER